MSIYSMIGLTAVAALLSVLLKRYNPEYSLIISIAAGVAVILFATGQLSPILERIESLTDSIGVNGRYIKILLKCLGICYITQMASDSLRDAGEGSLGNKIELLGKTVIAALTIPMLEQLVKTAVSLIKT